MASCTKCGNAIDVRRFCPACGADQGETLPPGREGEPAADPLLGRILGDRYEVLELLNVGGMGRVYRGRQRLLDRQVAVKFIHAHLLTSEGIATRFMTEAQASSRLNHPNVVSIFDFGQTLPADGGLLYLVMELLGGRDLCAELRRVGPLPPWRLASIFTQILAALGEAHHLGITHRDVKPDNVLLEPTRSGQDWVKVIDFGIAKIAGDRALTQVGRVVGTPEYMSPEQIQGRAAGPASDLYAVGVMLFQAVTGEFPFYGSPAEILAEQMTPARRDPRSLAQGRRVPAELAETVMRSLDPDPARRFPDAEAFAEAVVRAATSRTWSRADSLMFPPRTPTSVAVREPSPPSLSLPRLGALRTPSLVMEAAAAPGDGQPPFLGRAEDVAWALRFLRDADVPMILLWGRTGTGRTRLLFEVAAQAEHSGAHIVLCPADPHPYSELGYGAFERMIACLSEKPPSEDAPADRRSAVSALRAAAEGAVSRAGGRVVLLIDDIDGLDRPSLEAVRELGAGERVRDFQVVATAEKVLAASDGWKVQARRIHGLSAADAARVLGGERRARDLGRDSDIEPLLLDQLLRCPPDADLAGSSLREVVAWRIRTLSAAERRILQTVALTGGSPPAALASTLPRPDDIDEALKSLVEGGFVDAQQDLVLATHAKFGAVALAMAPLGAVTELHTRAAEELAGRRDLVELRAYHALRGEPDLGAFLLAEESVRLRASRGDREGAISVLRDAVEAGRRQLSRGDEMGESAWVLFGQKLGARLVEAERFDEARGVFKELLDVSALDDEARAVVLEQLVRIAERRDRPDEAAQHRRAAAAAAERAGGRVRA